MQNKGDASRCPECDWREGTFPDSADQLPPRTVLTGKYILGRVLGQGGFGITYLAWDIALRRKLAIKEYYPREICSRNRDSQTVQAVSRNRADDFQYGLTKFVEEGKNLARFRDYPGIVALHEFFEANGTAYLVMDYMEGMTFKQYLETHGGKISFEDALAILTPVMDALREVHRVGMLHRDISPDNIYLNQDRQVKILDFGATRYAMSEQSHSLTVLFKPGYAPIEQYGRGGKQGPWTDVYAVGATFYRALCGYAPDDAPDRMVHDNLILPSAKGIAIPPESEAALLRALAVKWENRFKEIQDFQTAINPVELIPPASTDRSRLIWFVATCILSLTTLTFAGLWFSANAENQHLRSTTPTGMTTPQRSDDVLQLSAELTRTKDNLDSAKAEVQSLKNRLSASAQSLSTAEADRTTLRAQNQQLTADLSSSRQTINQLQQQLARPPQGSPSLSVVYFQLFEWDRLTNAKIGPTTKFRASSTRRVLCTIGGPNSSYGRAQFTANVIIVFIGPDRTSKARIPLLVKADSNQPTWTTVGYYGSDSPGKLDIGNWAVEVWSDNQLVKRGTFTVY